MGSTEPISQGRQWHPDPYVARNSTCLAYLPERPAANAPVAGVLRESVPSLVSKPMGSQSRLEAGLVTTDGPCPWGDAFVPVPPPVPLPGFSLLWARSKVRDLSPPVTALRFAFAGRTLM